MLPNKNNNNMLPNKNKTILSEIKEFFTSSEKSINTVFDILRSLNLSDQHFDHIEDVRTTFTKANAVLLMLLFPLLDVRNVKCFCTSPFHALFSAGKDVFYRLKNNCRINWRELGYYVSLKLIRKAEKKSDPSVDLPRCLIIDDTDLPKTGRCIEMISRVWSHVEARCRLGFKGLFMGYHDGKSFFGVDFSLHGEKGKNTKKPYGLTPKQLKARYSKKRTGDVSDKERVKEYFEEKTQTMLSMIRTAIDKGLRFDYVLVDSWFVSECLIRFVLKRRFVCHLLGMTKMGKTRYELGDKKLTAKEIIEVLKRKKKTQRSKRLKVWYAIETVEYKGMKVKLFFCKTTHRGKWSVLLTTDTALNFEEAYRIYSMRWTIEVFFRESKQYFGLGKSQSRDFDAQIADTTISMLQYNVLALAKRFTDYESMGEIFRQAKAETLSLTLAEKIWNYLVEVLQIIAEIFEIEMDEILKKLVEENQTIIKLLNWEGLKNAA
jgi:hypothetical protein